MEINAIWDAIAPYVTGTGMGALIGGILFACLKGAFEKTINKVNVEKICNTAFEAQLKKIKSVSFSQNIQPIVEEQLRKIIPVFNEHLDKTLKQTQEKYQALLDVTIALTKYFENGYGIPEATKENLKKAILKAQEQLDTEEEVVNYAVSLDENNNVVQTTEIEVKIDKIEEPQQEIKAVR